MPRALAVALAALFALLHAAGAGAAGPPSVIRVGGPSAPDESKVAVIGSNHDLRGHRFSVSDGDGDVVLRGKLNRRPGPAGPLAPRLSPRT